MNKYIVTGRLLNIHSGNVQLNDDQVNRYADNIEHKEGSTYSVVNPIQIPKGDTIICDINVNPFNATKINDPVIVEQIKQQEVDAIDEAEDNEEKKQDIVADDLESLHWREIKELVEAADGEWVNKKEGIQFLRLNAETKTDDD